MNVTWYLRKKNSISTVEIHKKMFLSFSRELTHSHDDNKQQEQFLFIGFNCLDSFGNTWNFAWTELLITIDLLIKGDPWDILKNWRKKNSKNGLKTIMINSCHNFLSLCALEIRSPGPSLHLVFLALGTWSPHPNYCGWRQDNF